jgi:hypothetical protein
VYTYVGYNIANIRSIIQIIHRLDATISPVYDPDVYLQLNMFREFSRPSSGAQQLQQQPLVLPSYCVDSSDVVYHHDTKVKPVVKLLMMGVRTPETC